MQSVLISVSNLLLGWKLNKFFEVMSKVEEFEVVEPTLVGFKSSSEDDFHWLPEINRSPKKYKINVMFMTASSSTNHENR